jgi:predicted HTH domain antitoxin
MPLVIDDKVLAEAGLTEQAARIEFACRLYELGKLSKVAAAQLSGLDRVGFESELQKRGIDIFRYTDRDLQQDLDTLDRVLGRP